MKKWEITYNLIKSEQITEIVTAETEEDALQQVEQELEDLIDAWYSFDNGETYFSYDIIDIELVEYDENEEEEDE